MEAFNVHQGKKQYSNIGPDNIQKLALQELKIPDGYPFTIPW